MSDRGMVLIKIPTRYGQSFRRFSGTMSSGKDVLVCLVSGMHTERATEIFEAKDAEQAREIALRLAVLITHGESGVYEVNNQGLIVRVTTPS